MFTGLQAAHAHPTRRWTTVVSFSLQAMLVAGALVFPILRPAGLPDAFQLRRIFLPVPQGMQQPRANPNVNNPISTNAPVFPIIVRTGPSLRMTNVGPTSGNISSPPSMSTIGDLNSDITSIISDSHYQPMPQRPQAAVRRVAPVSVMMEGNLVRKIEPRYPTIAMQMGIQGTVIIKALISRAGAVERPQVVSGQPFLATAAIEAVKEWRYRPYYLNGQPVEVETEITVNFVLQR